MPGPSFHYNHKTGKLEYPTGHTKPSGEAVTTTNPSKAYVRPPSVPIGSPTPPPSSPTPTRRYTPRTVPTPSILGTLSDLITPGPSAKQTAEAAHRLGVRPQEQKPQGLGEAAGSLIHSAAQGVNKIAQDVADIPKQRISSDLGRKTLGTPTIGQVAHAVLQGKAKVNQRGKLTIPVTRRAARQLAGARAAVRKSSGGDGSVESQVGHYLLQHGLNKKAVAGILGNAYAESSYQTGATGYGGGGLWGFTAHPNSLSDLQSFAASQGQQWTDPKVQSAFLLQHVSPQLVQQLNAAPTPRAAASTFMQQFERPGIPRQEVREQAAAQAFASGKWGKPNPQALAQLQAAKGAAAKLGIPVKAGDTEPGPAPKTVFVRADAEGMVQWAKALLGTQEGSRLQLKWAGEAGISAAQPWCAAFITAGMLRRGLQPPPDPAFSGSWLSWKGGTNIGTDLSHAKPGDVIVFGASEHIGLYVGGGKVIAGNWSNEVAEYPASEDSRGIEGIVRPHFKGGKVAVKESAVLPGAAIGPSGELVSGPAGVGASETAGGGGGARPGITGATSLNPLNPLITPTTEVDLQGEGEPEDIVQAILRRRRG